MEPTNKWERFIQHNAVGGADFFRVSMPEHKSVGPAIDVTRVPEPFAQRVLEGSHWPQLFDLLPVPLSCKESTAAFLTNGLAMVLFERKNSHQ